MSGAAGGDAATEVGWLALAATPGRGAARASGALLVERLHQQRGKGRCDKHVEMPDTREVAEDQRHGGREFLQQRADARINFLAPAAALEVATDDLVQRVVARAVVGGHAHALGEFLREHAHEREFTARAVGHREEFGADKGNHPLLPDVVEQIGPKKILVQWGGLKRGGEGCARAGSSYEAVDAGHG